MARIAGINIPDNKRIEIALTYIFGIGNKSAKDIIKTAQINVDKRTKDLTTEEIDRIRNIIEKNYKIEGDLKMVINQNIKRLKEVGTYRGLRHSKNLPVRGQRTKTNARTKRGKRICVGSGRKAAAEKT
ncbi:MAG: 30S ribosomal protein S13 [Patescibacteria group bacterium]|nr:30S ribosomal protein S13 [Patescibacteria group bacterium]